MTAQRDLVSRYCKVPVENALLADLLPGPVTLVFERSEVLNADLNPFTSVSPLQKIKMQSNVFQRMSVMFGLHVSVPLSS